MKENKKWWKYVRPGHTLQCLNKPPKYFRGQGYYPDETFTVIKIHNGAVPNTRIAFMNSENLPVWSDSCKPYYKVGDWVVITGVGSTVTNIFMEDNKSHYGKIIGDCVQIEFVTPEYGIASEKDLRYYGENWNCRSEDLRYATEEEINLVKNKIEVFTLPEKWCVKFNNDNRKTLISWITSHSDYNSNYNMFKGWCVNYTPDRSYQNYCLCKPSNYTEITFEQFQKYVLKKDNEGICTNSSTSYGSCGETEGCKQHCNSCEFYSLNQVNKEMTKEELLEEAKRRYPIGTKFRFAHLNHSKEYGIITNSNFQFTTRQGCEIGIVVLTDEGNYWAESSNKRYGTGRYDRIVYKDGKWAEIVQDTLKVEDLVEGEIYYCSYLNKDDPQASYVFKYKCKSNKNNRNPHWIDTFEQITKGGYFETNGSFANKDYTNYLRLATQEEKDWLNYCIKVNKFVPKDEALKSKEMKFEKGKWYKSPEWDKFYIKVDKFVGDKVYTKEKISNNKYVVEKYVYDYKLDSYTQVPLAEIQQYLPVNHPDKIQDEWWKTLKKGDVVRCIAGEGNGGNRKVGEEYTLCKDYDGYIWYRKTWYSDKYDEFELVRRANQDLEDNISEDPNDKDVVDAIAATMKYLNEVMNLPKKESPKDKVKVIKIYTDSPQIKKVDEFVKLNIRKVNKIKI